MDKVFTTDFKIVETENLHSYALYYVRNDGQIILETRNSVLAQWLCNKLNEENPALSAMLFGK